MLEPRNILYFDQFYFKNGNAAKAKYFIVLKRIENRAILASLPTSKDHIPYFVMQKDGCIEMPEINLNCFVISPETCVSECGKHFPRKTFLYGQNIDEYEISFMENTYQLKNIDFVIWGRMKESLFHKLINCFLNSKSIKRKYKVILV